MTALAVSLAASVALLALLVVGLLRSHGAMLRTMHDLGIRDERSVTSGGIGVPSDRPPTATAPGVASPRAGVDLGQAHDIDGVDPDGARVEWSLSESDRRTLLVFLSTSCSTCHVFWASLADSTHRASLEAGIEPLVVTQGPEVEDELSVAALAPADVDLVMSTAAWEQFQVPVSPYFILVENGRIVGEGSGGTWHQVTALIGRARDDAGVPR